MNSDLFANNKMWPIYKEGTYMPSHLLENFSHSPIEMADFQSNSMNEFKYENLNDVELADSPLISDNKKSYLTSLRNGTGYILKKLGFTHNKWHSLAQVLCTTLAAYQTYNLSKSMVGNDDVGMAFTIPTTIIISALTLRGVGYSLKNAGALVVLVEEMKEKLMILWEKFHKSVEKIKSDSQDSENIRNNMKILTEQFKEMAALKIQIDNMQSHVKEFSTLKIQIDNMQSQVDFMETKIDLIILTDEKPDRTERTERTEQDKRILAQSVAAKVNRNCGLFP
jgi:hypothetical protein